MTKEEAMDLLDNLIGMVEDSQDNDYDEALKMGIKALERIPNAFPTHECVNPTHECDDLISRQAAITLPVMPKEHREYQTYNLDDAYEQGWFDLQKCIEGLPSAEPKTGEWIDEGDPLTIRCSKCDYRAARYNNTNYCPNCGADMRGADDDI